MGGERDRGRGQVRSGSGEREKHKVDSYKQTDGRETCERVRERERDRAGENRDMETILIFLKISLQIFAYQICCVEENSRAAKSPKLLVASPKDSQKWLDFFPNWQGAQRNTNRLIKIVFY